MYRKCFDVVNNKEALCVIRIDDNAVIPFDAMNRDYREYLAWVAEGNTPEPWEPN